LIHAEVSAYPMGTNTTSLQNLGLGFPFLLAFLGGQYIQRMAEEEKAYPDLMKEICAVHSELESVEQVIVQDLSEHDSNKS